MKTFKCILFSFAVFAGDVSHAAIVHLTRELGQFETFTDFEVMRTSLFGNSYGQLNSLTNSLAISADTLADTASFTDMQFGVTLEGGGTRTQTSTTVTPPTDFPNPPIFTTTTFTETVTLDPLSPADLAPQFLSSTVASLEYRAGFVYGFPSNVTIAFPDSFTVSGTYHVQGPTQMVTVPFNVLYSRDTSANVTNDWLGFIGVGTSFPDTALISAYHRDSETYANYRPANQTISVGMVDGRSVNLTFNDLVIVAALPIPEPMSVCLWVIGVIGCLRLRILPAKKRRAV